MTKSKKSKIYNLLILVVIALMLIPQTRKPIQVVVNKAIAFFVKPSVIEASERTKLSSYKWSLQDINGNQFDFKTAEGKVIVINFWATWCPPCIAEMPSLEKLYQHFKSNDDLVFLFVSNEDKEKLYEFMVHEGYSFNVYQSISNYPKTFDVSSIPRTFVINRSGEIIIDKSGAADWNSEHVIETLDNALKAF
ncbi:TlpA disulfide reductase family protein [uncultured Psychroserpens sp.]|uniref:TlpA family protein disulfide reductase n=1 Tax=uncultured Psychroserpens sp. TaxID=255436 RepID=UPI0026370E3F|nr:TlpA disulfide reductase family protein [uncultured Psychroserpens sp.]